MMIIAGLGNPGKKYEWTRHNSGFAAVDILARMHSTSIDHPFLNGLTGSCVIGAQKVLLVKPQTFMNLSGDCIGSICRYYRVDPTSELVVIYDDVSLPEGQLRVRGKGSDGGHNGLKSIIASLGTQEFKRVRIGVGAVPEGYMMADWVLGRFPLLHRADMIGTFDRAARAAEALAEQPLDQVMNTFNVKVTE